MIALLVIWACALARAMNIDSPEQYATVLASDQWTPTLPVQSPFLGILYMTVTALPNYSMNASMNMFAIETFLFHNVDYATDASVWGPGPRGSVTESGGAHRLFLLYPPGSTPASTSCPLFTYTTVDESVVVALRQGDLYAVISSGGLDAGELRGQIETRNDIYILPIIDPNSVGNENRTETTSVNLTSDYNGTINDSFNLTVTGAALIRTYDDTPDCGAGNTPQPALSKPVSIDFYILSSSELALSFIGIPVGSGLAAVDFGVMPSGVSNIDLLFDTGSCIDRRGDIELLSPPFGFNSSNLDLYYETYDFDTGIYNRTLLGRFIRLPLVKVVGNEVSVFDYNSSFGGGNNPERPIVVQKKKKRTLPIVVGTLLGLGVIAYAIVMMCLIK